MFLSKLSTPTKLVLAGQVLALGYSLRKKKYVGSIVAAMTIGGVIVGELQALRLGAAKRGMTTISEFGQLRLV